MSRHILEAARAAAVIALFVPASAFAHGAVRFEQEACVLKVGPDFMYFSGYQPVVSQKKFCEDIPETGETLFVFDYAQDELRKMNADFRILRSAGDADDTDDAASLAQRTLAYLPPKAYPSGTLNFSYDFKEKGDYVGIVTLSGPDGEHWVARFPFAVGHSETPRTPYYLLTAAFVLAFLLLFWGKSEKPR